jgi:hypothetical protein
LDHADLEGHARLLSFIAGYSGTPGGKRQFDDQLELGRQLVADIITR